MGFDTYGAAARILTETIDAIKDLAVTSEIATMSSCCGTTNPCSPRPVDVDITSTAITFDGVTTAGWLTNVLTVSGVSGSQISVLTLSPVAAANLAVYVNGVLQVNLTDYTWNGTTTITWLVDPPVGATVIAHYLTTEV